MSTGRWLDEGARTRSGMSHACHRARGPGHSRKTAERRSEAPLSRLAGPERGGGGPQGAGGRGAAPVGSSAAGAPGVGVTLRPACLPVSASSGTALGHGPRLSPAREWGPGVLVRWVMSCPPSVRSQARGCHY